MHTKLRDNYLEHGESYFYEEHSGKCGGNRYAALHTKKNLSKEERLELENLNFNCLKTLVEKTKEQTDLITLLTFVFVQIANKYFNRYYNKDLFNLIKQHDNPTAIAEIISCLILVLGVVIILILIGLDLRT